MFVTWGNVYNSALGTDGVDNTVTLDMTFQLNLHNMADLATGEEQAAPASGANIGETPFLNFYLTFLNPSATTITTLTYDAFAGMIQFRGEALTDPTDSTKDGIKWLPMTKAATAVTDGLSLANYGNDWTASGSNTLTAPDTGDNDEYRIQEVAGALSTEYNECTEVFYVSSVNT